jgi:hypothetical protein
MSGTKELKMIWKMALDGSLVATWRESRRHSKPSRSGDGPRGQGVRVKKLCLILLALLLIPTPATPQRYGRPYTPVGLPTLLLEVSVGRKTHYFSQYDLRRMPRSVATETEPTTKQTHIYEGVALDQLVAIATLTSTGETIQIESGSHQTQTLSGNDLATETNLIVVDTVDGKPLSLYRPYCFVAIFRDKAPLIASDVRSIKIGTRNSPENKSWKGAYAARIRVPVGAVGS